MPRSESPIRLLTAVPICDGHDSAINTINFELVRHGMEVVYLGYHRPAADIVRAAIQEDVRAIGISSYNGGHVEFFSQVISLLRSKGAGHIGVFGGGGGTISRADAAVMQRRGVARIFFPGTPLDEIAAFAAGHYRKPKKPAAGNRDSPRSPDDRELAALLTRAESGAANRSARAAAAGSGRVVGISGPGGAGKTTLIDEIVLRFLRERPQARVAVLSHDPGAAGRGALLGDRATMVYSQHDRVFMRSLSTRGRPGGLAPATENCLRILRGPRWAFDLILVETVGTGQEAAPFPNGLVDKQVLVMSPHYGARLQLQKIVQLDEADIVVVNKSDMAAATTANAEIGQRLARNRRGQILAATVANRHADPGVDRLYELLKP